MLGEFIEGAKTEVNGQEVQLVFTRVSELEGYTLDHFLRIQAMNHALAVRIDRFDNISPVDMAREIVEIANLFEPYLRGESESR